jgi:hypothetical protein
MAAIGGYYLNALQGSQTRISGPLDRGDARLTDIESTRSLA